MYVGAMGVQSRPDCIVRIILTADNQNVAKGAFHAIRPWRAGRNPCGGVCRKKRLSLAGPANKQGDTP
jgi:hypothetical protein